MSTVLFPFSCVLEAALFQSALVDSSCHLLSKLFPQTAPSFGEAVVVDNN